MKTSITSNLRPLLRDFYPFLIAIAVLWAVPRNAHAQLLGTPPSNPYKPQAPDNQLQQLLNQIDQNQLQATVQKLINFGTRHTASSQTDPVRGIGAATAWVFQQLQTYAAASGGHGRGVSNAVQ